jgi:DNA-directed RNA polymerase subunit M/transcription elongation factor TFIIS
MMVNLNQSENTCPNCNSQEINYDENFGFYRCNSCNYAWGYAQDDPDFEEYNGFTCPKCGSNKSFVDDIRAADPLDETIEAINFTCLDCEHGWIERV